MSSSGLTRIGVVALLTALEAVVLLDVALMLRAGLNPVAFLLAAAVFAPWLIIEVRRILAARAVRRCGAAQLAPVSQLHPTALRPRVSTYTGPVHTAATNPTGRRMAARSDVSGDQSDYTSGEAAAA